MSRVSSKSYDSFVGKLEAMSSGIKKHEKNEKISANFKDANLKVLKDNLEALRSDYISKETEARKAFDVLTEKLKEAQAVHAGSTRVVKGLLGRTAEDLKDFGISPEKSRVKKLKPKL